MKIIYFGQYILFHLAKCRILHIFVEHSQHNDDDDDDNFFLIINEEVEDSAEEARTRCEKWDGFVFLYVCQCGEFLNTALFISVVI